MIKIAITGCCGRMGQSIAALAIKDEDFRITGAVEAKSHPDMSRSFGEVIGESGFDLKITSDLAQAVKGADVIIDFTSPRATILNLGVARTAKLPIVIGTTGLADEEMRVLKAASSSIPVLYSANMSIGINLLFRIAPEIAGALGPDYDIEIIEMHHNKKKDAPSGTAKKLAELIAEAKGKILNELGIYGREGNVGERPRDQIGIHSVRAGDVVGEHTIIYAGENERIEITHRASSRNAFAQGALRAAKYLIDKSPGLYSMQDVIEGV